MVRRGVLALLGVLAVLAGTAFGVRAATAKPGFSLAAGPTSQSIQQGQAADYTVRVDAGNGFAGTVTLAVTGLPYGVTGTLAPASVSLGSSLPTASATLHLATAPGTAPGSYPLTVTGKGGGKSHSVGVQLVVNRALTASFTVAAAPASMTVAPGAAAVYSLTFTRHLFGYPIGLSTSGLPAGATATYAPNPVSGTAATLEVTTTGATRAGSYPLTVVASARGIAQRVQVVLVVDTTASSKPFGLSGTPAGMLAPGAAPARIDLLVTNPNNQPLSVTGLTVRVTGTGKAGCTVAEFAVTQYTGAYPLTVPKNSTRSLSQLGIPASQLPKVAMLDLARNQDACKSAAVSLSYSGSARGN